MVSRSSSEDEDASAVTAAAQPDMSLFLEETRWRRDDQIRRIAGLNQKLVTSLTLNLAIVGFLGAAMSLGRADLSTGAIAMFIVTVIMFVVNCFISGWGYGGTTWSRRPDLLTLRRHLSSYDTDTMKEWAADEMGASIAVNEPRVRRKARYVAWSLGFTVLDGFLAGLAIVAALIG